MRTKSLVFDDDVIETFGNVDHKFTVAGIIEKWQLGEADAAISRKAIIQAIVALTAIGRPPKQWEITTEQGKLLFKGLANKYPALMLGTKPQ